MVRHYSRRLLFQPSGVDSEDTSRRERVKRPHVYLRVHPLVFLRVPVRYLFGAEEKQRIGEQERGNMADLSDDDKRALFGPNWREIDAQLEAESARKREKWKRLVPFALALAGAVSVYVIAAEAFF
jgi:hypothetical protein